MAGQRHQLVDPAPHPVDHVAHLGEGDQHDPCRRQPGAQGAQRGNRAEQVAQPGPQPHDRDRVRLVVERRAHGREGIAGALVSSGS
jgi:hypothetical protein